MKRILDSPFLVPIREVERERERERELEISIYVREEEKGVLILLNQN
jgi:hypothetical protein